MTRISGKWKRRERKSKREREYDVLGTKVTGGDDELIAEASARQRAVAEESGGRVGGGVGGGERKEK